MTPNPAGFARPPRFARRDGDERRVGFELEFTGLNIDQVGECLEQALGGTLITESAAERRLQVSDVGEFNIELDWDYLKKRAAQEDDAAPGGDWLLEALKSAASLVVPLEVVCPPLPLPTLELLPYSP